jgi:hypothetical protein
MTDRRVNSLEYLGLHRHQHTNVTADIAQEAETPSARPTMQNKSLTCQVCPKRVRQSVNVRTAVPIVPSLCIPYPALGHIAKNLSDYKIHLESLLFEQTLQNYKYNQLR